MDWKRKRFFLKDYIVANVRYISPIDLQSSCQCEIYIPTGSTRKQVVPNDLQKSCKYQLQMHYNWMAACLIHLLEYFIIVNYVKNYVFSHTFWVLD